MELEVFGNVKVDLTRGSSDGMRG